jgi:hypothetical protein
LSADELRDALNRWAPVANSFDPSWRPNIGFDELTRRSSRDEWEDQEPALVAPLGPVLFLIDLVAATHCLSEAHVRPPGGSATQGWTDLFEDQVQAVLNASLWSPPEVVRRLRKRTIRRHDGTAITDLDAVGFYDGVLLLVDAKAWTTNARLQHGEHDAVRTRRETVEAAAAAWDKKIEDVRARLPVQVHDQTLIREIYGVVVCPDVPYVLPGHCTDELLPGLRKVATLAELGRFAESSAYVDPPTGLFDQIRWLRDLP